jgi:GT2 family glycosyltransferase
MQVGTWEAFKVTARRLLTLTRTRFTRRYQHPCVSSREADAHVKGLIRKGAVTDERARESWLGQILALASERLTGRSEALVTVVIPSFDRPDELLACLHSLVLWPKEMKIHVIVSDDASTSFDPSQWPSSTGITFLRQSANLGYVRNLNFAMTHCLSDFVMTLNQDTVCFPNAIEELVLGLDEGTGTHVVGPMVLSPSLCVQEVGGIVDPSGEAAHRGRGALPLDPRWTFSSDVTYVSGCAMLMRRSTWEALRGLDEVFSPAYYDDTDLCLRAWAAGFRVRVIPTAMIVHREGTVMGRDPSDIDSPKHNQIRNRALCASRNEEILAAIAEAEPPPLVCFVAERPPRPNQDGGSLDFDLFMRYSMEQGLRVRLLLRHEHLSPDLLPLRRAGIGCASVDGWEGREWLGEAALVISLGIHAGIDVERTLRDHFSAPWVHFTSDVATRRMQSACAVDTQALPLYTDLPSEPDLLWQLEASVYSSAEEVLFVSREDRAFAHESGYPRDKGTVFPIMRGESPPVLESAPTPHPVVSFVGAMTHGPNVDAVDWFIRAVWPELMKLMPEGRLDIWGSGIGAHLQRRWVCAPSVRVRGDFATWSEVAHGTRVTVAPLRFGAGVKGKVVSSLQWGLPVIGTPLAFDGLPRKTADLACNSISQWVDRLQSALTDDDEWWSLLTRGRWALGEEFTPEAEMMRVTQLLHRHGVKTKAKGSNHGATKDVDTEIFPSPMPRMSQ